MKRRNLLLSAAGAAVVSIPVEIGAQEMLPGTRPSAPVDLSPARWPAQVRARVEQQEFRSLNWAPDVAQSFRSKTGIISATVSPIAVQAGLETLGQGGSAADAAIAVALTQITTALGSVVSFAGIMTALYYDAKTGTIASLDAGWNSYRYERDPLTICPTNLGLITGAAPAPPPKDVGRQTLVPGFMAGIGALHARFGRLPFSDLFAPAVWYAQNGVTISGPLDWYFQFRRDVLSRTPEGLRFLQQAGDNLPKFGDVFRQAELAATLRSIAKDGATSMYTGAWAKAFVSAVQRYGGKVTTEDLANYRPNWSEAAKTEVFGHQVYVPGPPNLSAYQLLTALNMTEALHLEQGGPYWQDPETLRELSRIGLALIAAPTILPDTKSQLLELKIDISPEAQRRKKFATALAAILPAVYAPATSGNPHHSDAIVVVDREGNIAAMTHTINTLIWGDTGIVVGGIPIGDAAGFQQTALAAIKPGSRLPNNIADCIVLNSSNQPVLATASIGASLVPDSLSRIFSIIGQHQDLATVVAAPPLLIVTDPKSYALPLAKIPVNIPMGAYESQFVEQLKLSGVDVVEVPQMTVAALRGSLAIVTIDRHSGEKATKETPGVMVFGGAENQG